MLKPRTVAIDGPVAAGKNAVGSLLAKRLGYRFVDTGAMYRALTWHALKLGVDLRDGEALSKLAVDTDIDLVSSVGSCDSCAVVINGRDVSSEIRGEEVERGVSLVAMVGGVRRQLVATQRQMARKDEVVMIGRDIGTVVLPDADLKVYLSASARERARRRHLELLQRGRQVAFERVLADLERRDRLDSGRALSPLQPAPDARIVDTDGLDVEQVVGEILRIIEAGQ